MYGTLKSNFQVRRGIKFFTKKVWLYREFQTIVDPPPIPLSKSKINTKLDKYDFKIKLRRNPTSETSGMYEFKMELFDHGDLEEFLLFQHNYQIKLEE